MNFQRKNQIQKMLIITAKRLMQLKMMIAQINIYMKIISKCIALNGACKLITIVAECLDKYFNKKNKNSHFEMSLCECNAVVNCTRVYPHRLLLYEW